MPPLKLKVLFYLSNEGVSMDFLDGRSCYCLLACCLFTSSDYFAGLCSILSKAECNQGGGCHYLPVG